MGLMTMFLDLFLLVYIIIGIMGCDEKKTGAKYLLRPTPPYSAYECAWRKKTGNDGKQYTSVPNDQGQFIWAPITRHMKTSTKLKVLARLGIHYASKFIIDKLTDDEFHLAARGQLPNFSKKSRTNILKMAGKKVYADHVAHLFKKSK